MSERGDAPSTDLPVTPLRPQTMVEKVAEAIVNRRREIALAKGGPIVLEPIELARAAIEAMREPTPDMCAAHYDLARAQNTLAVAASDTWQAMIDAALEGKAE